MIRYLASLRPVEISTLNGPDEMIEFKLPLELAESTPPVPATVEADGSDAS